LSDSIYIDIIQVAYIVMVIGFVIFRCNEQHITFMPTFKEILASYAFIMSIPGGVTILGCFFMLIKTSFVLEVYITVYNTPSCLVHLYV